jgi:RNA recognition motif-containing protein
VGGLAPEVEDQDLRDHFYPYGEISSIKVGYFFIHIYQHLLVTYVSLLLESAGSVQAAEVPRVWASRVWRSNRTCVVCQILSARHCAFVTFATRQAAERAAQELQHKLIVHGQRAKLMWGKPQEKRTIEMPYQDGQAPPEGGARPPPMSMLPPQVRTLPLSSHIVPL